MALATQCPHCHTTFRVAHDQLKLRAGLVRCGACKQIFNGIENLLRPEEAEKIAKPVPPSAQPPAPSADEPTPAMAAATEPGEPVHAQSANTDFVPAQEMRDDAEDGPVPAEEPMPPVESAMPVPTETVSNDDPLLRMTLMDFAHVRPPTAAGTPPTPENESDPVEQAIDDLQNKPWRGEQEPEDDASVDPLDQADDAEYEEPRFVKQGRRRRRLGRALRAFMATASVLLLIGLLAQSAYVFRNQIAARFPETRPLLVEACMRLACQIGLPANIESVSIESSELQSLSPNSDRFSLTVLLRNHGGTVQAWPNLELTLNDSKEKPLVRRVFQPREYLPDAQEFSKGFAPRSEQALKLFFEVGQLKASGYRVYVFYP